MSNRLNSKHYDKQSVSLPILNSALDTNSDEKKPRSKDDSDYDRVTTLMSHFNLSNPNRFSPSNRMRYVQHLEAKKGKTMFVSAFFAVFWSKIPQKNIPPSVPFSCLVCLLLDTLCLCLADSYL